MAHPRPAARAHQAELNGNLGMQNWRLWHGGAAQGPRAQGEGCVCGDAQATGICRRTKGLWVPGYSLRTAGSRGAFLQRLPQRSHCSLEGSSSEVLSWPRQLLRCCTKRQACSTVGWHFSPCRLCNSHGEVIYQHRVCSQSPGLCFTSRYHPAPWLLMKQ